MDINTPVSIFVLTFRLISGLVLRWWSALLCIRVQVRFIFHQMHKIEDPPPRGPPEHKHQEHVIQEGHNYFTVISGKHFVQIGPTIFSYLFHRCLNHIFKKVDELFVHNLMKWWCWTSQETINKQLYLQTRLKLCGKLCVCVGVLIKSDKINIFTNKENMENLMPVSDFIVFYVSVPG